LKLKLKKVMDRRTDMENEDGFQQPEDSFDFESGPTPSGPTAENPNRKKKQTKKIKKKKNPDDINIGDEIVKFVRSN
jgi:hypothetical protein